MIENQLRESILGEANKRELTAYALAKLAGIDARMVQRYFSGDRDLTTESASRLCNALGLQLKASKRTKAKSD